MYTHVVHVDCVPFSPVQSYYALEDVLEMDVPEDGKVAYTLLASSVLDKAVAKLYHRVFQAVRGYFA